MALVDTGSVRGLQISARLQQALAIKAETRTGTNQRYEGGGRAVFSGVADEFVLGPYRGVAEPVEIVAGDIEAIATQVRTPFDAILGWPLLSRFDFAIDYRARRMRLDTDGPPPTGAVWRLPLVVGKALPVVEGMIDGRSVALLVDTGAPMSNLDISAATEPPGAQVTRTLDLSGRTQPHRFRIKDLTPIRRSLGCTAVLGHNFFDGTQVRYRRDKASFEID